MPRGRNSRKCSKKCSLSNQIESGMASPLWQCTCIFSKAFRGVPWMIHCTFPSSSSSSGNSTTSYQLLVGFISHLRQRCYITTLWADWSRVKQNLKRFFTSFVTRLRWNRKLRWVKSVVVNIIGGRTWSQMLCLFHFAIMPNCSSVPFHTRSAKAMAGWMVSRMDVISWDVWQMSSRRSACNNVGPCSIGKVGLRQMGLKWPYSYGWYVVWWGSKSKHHQDTCSSEIGVCLHVLITTLHSLVITIGRIYVSS